MQDAWIRKPTGDTTVVFVHGILSGGESCWRHSDGAYWPELLKNETGLENLGIYVYSYQTDINSGSYSISDIVDDLKETLFNSPDTPLNKKLIFVCHSMGGLVVRRFIVQQSVALMERGVELGLFLVASPSLGAKYANWLEPIAKFAGHEQAKALRFSQTNQWLNDLDTDFFNLKEQGRLILHGKELLEDKFVVFKKTWFKPEQIVPPFSASRYFGDHYKVPGSDHFSIAKPADREAKQHQRLLEFIKKYEAEFSKNSLPPINPDKKKSEAKRGNGNEAGTGNIPQLWQAELKARLEKQLEDPVFQPVVRVFVEKLKRDLPNLPSDDWQEIADYLVTGQGDRHKQVSQFLVALKETGQSSEKQSQVMLAYLLQTLVRKCHDNEDQGKTRIHLKDMETVGLVSATRTTTPCIPGYAEGNLEHTNGQKDPLCQNIGHFLPETGQWDVTSICQAIARDLLPAFGYQADTGDENPLNTLRGALRSYVAAPQYAPKQGLLIEHGSKNPALIDEVAAGLKEALNGLLWVYVYGGQDWDKWLHADESDVKGLVMNYRLQQVAPKTISPTQNRTEESTMPPVINVGNIGDNATVSINTGKQNRTQIGQGNIQLSGQDTKTLLTLLEQLKTEANQENKVGKQEYAALDQASLAIEAQANKPEGLAKTALASLKTVLDGFKDIESLGGTISNITQLLLPLIG